jgi:hypothetical protein
MDVAIQLSRLSFGQRTASRHLAQFVHPRYITLLELQREKIFSRIAGQIVSPGLDEAREYAGLRILPEKLRVRGLAAFILSC